MKLRIFLVPVACCWFSACASHSLTSAEQGALKLRYATAGEAYKNGELSTAETHYLALVRNDPEFAEGWFRLGNIYVRTGQLDAAVNMYEKALKLNPEDGKVWNNLALARVKQAVAALDEGAINVGQESGERVAMTTLRKRIVDATLTRR